MQITAARKPGEGKIDGAYAYAYVQYVNQNVGKESNADLYLHANQAGQAATIATVSAVTGQKIDHFVNPPELLALLKQIH